MPNQTFTGLIWLFLAAKSTLAAPDTAPFDSGQRFEIDFKSMRGEEVTQIGARVGMTGISGRGEAVNTDNHPYRL